VQATQSLPTQVQSAPAKEATGWATSSAYGPPAYGAAAYGGYDVPPTGAGGNTTAKKPDNRTILIIVAIVVLVVLLLTVGWFAFLRGGSTSFTLGGKKISHPSDVITQADANLQSVVKARHGASNGDTRCYYAVPTSPAANRKKTDIQPALQCGPVLFVDGTPSKEYLTFALSSQAAGSGVTLTAATKPTTDNPAAVPADVVLKRPDGKKPSTGASGLTAPTPPAAAPDSIHTGTVPSTGNPPITAIVGSLGGGITITDVGPVTRFGTGDNAFSAPLNQKLIAFSLAGAAGNDNTVVDLSSSTTLSVDGGPGRTLPKANAGEDIIAAVPNSAKSVDLVLQDSGITQTFSLLDGKPGATNLAVLARAHRTDAISQAVSVTFNYSTRVVFTDGVTAQTQTASVSLTGATLTYRDDDNSVSASSPSDALLIPSIVYTGGHDGGPYGVDTALLSFTPTGGTPIAARNISTDPTKIRNVFEVPAGITTGTLTVGGTATESFSSGGGTYTLTVAKPMSFPISFAAG
jgi:hypothetical protein